jgi:hypothetical protein
MTTTIIGQAVNATLGQVVYGERHPARGGVIVAVMDRALDLIDEPRRQLLRADNTGGVRASCCLPRARHIARSGAGPPADAKHRTIGARLSDIRGE